MPLCKQAPTKTSHLTAPIEWGEPDSSCVLKGIFHTDSRRKTKTHLLQGIGIQIVWLSLFTAVTSLLQVCAHGAKWLPTAGAIQTTGIHPCHINIAAGIRDNTDIQIKQVVGTDYPPQSVDGSIRAPSHCISEHRKILLLSLLPLNLGLGLIHFEYT